MDTLQLDLKEAYLEQIRSLAASHLSIEKIVLFGSRAKATAGKHSDLDLCVFLSDPKDISAQHFKLDLEEDTLIPHQFDVVYWHTLSDEKFKAEILRDGVVIYARS